MVECTEEQLRILIVDDEPASREGLRDLMPWAEFRAVVVGAAQDGEEAIRVARETVPQVVVTDIVMPGMSGLALVAELQSEHPLIQSILVSGHDDHAFVRAGMGLSAVDYLLKPVHKDSLAEALIRARRRIEARQSAESTTRELHTRYLNSLDYVRDRLFSDLIAGRIMHRSELARRARDAEVELPMESTYRLCAATVSAPLDVLPTPVDESGWVFAMGERIWLLTRRVELATALLQLQKATQTIGVQSDTPAATRVIGTPAATSPLDLAAAATGIMREEPLSVASAGGGMSPRDPDEPAVVTLARSVIEAEFSNDISVSDIASRARVSESHLSHLFRQATGRTVVAYLADVRIAHAVRLLRDPRWRVGEIAAAVGYHDPKYFARVFRGAMGTRPSVFRRSLSADS